MQTHTEENYLKSIYNLASLNTGKVSVTGLAAALGNNPASVIDMLKRMVDKRLIRYDKVKGVRLTESGVKSALETIRKHRLWEMFLQEKLGYGWDEVHEIAEELEHVRGINLADRLDKFLGYPEFDPHGEVIPKADGKFTHLDEKALNETETGRDYKVVSVKDTSRSFLKYLEKLNISIGTIIRVLEKIDFDDSLIISVKGVKNTISSKLASNILIGTN
ncbi:MAG TPA: metal-dependent transcriptional regulator [Bacteroidales bacterium]|nr:metal-dependent transcriptional regulator [Bacteroidales bacterium]